MFYALLKVNLSDLNQHKLNNWSKQLQITKKCHCSLISTQFFFPTRKK